MTNTVTVYYEEDENGEWYTAVINDEAFQMNTNPNHPQAGVNQFIGHVEGGKIAKDALGEEIAFEDCPDPVQAAIRDRTPDDMNV